jgi:hypothetical protein
MVFLFLALEIEPRALHTLSTNSAAKLHNSYNYHSLHREKKFVTGINRLRFFCEFQDNETQINCSFPNSLCNTYGILKYGYKEYADNLRNTHLIKIRKYFHQKQPEVR